MPFSPLAGMSPVVPCGSPFRPPAVARKSAVWDHRHAMQPVALSGSSGPDFRPVTAVNSGRAFLWAACSRRVVLSGQRLGQWVALAVVVVCTFWILACGSIGISPTATPVPTSTPAPTPTPVQFKSTSFKVDAGAVYEVSVPMREGHRLEYRFTANLDVDFEIVSPMGLQRARKDRVTATEGALTAAETGVHKLRFDNGFSWLTAKNISLTYRVTPQ